MTTIKIHNVETGEIIERDMTAQELDQLELDRQSAAKYIEAENEVKAKRLTALAKLEALGLTPADLKVLGL